MHITKSDYSPIRNDKLGKLLILIWSIPLLWILGGERLLLPALIVIATLQFGPWDGRVHRAQLWLGAFLVAYLLSFVQVSTAERYITFVWDFVIYASIFLTISNILRANASLEDIERLLRTLVLVSMFFHFLALTYFIFGDWKFETLIGKFLPGALRNTQVGQKIAVHGVGRELYFLGLNTRLASVFMSSMQYAAATLLITPFALFFAIVGRGKAKLVYGLAFIACLLGLFFSQGRAAMLITASIVPILMACAALYGLGLLSNRTVVFSAIGLAIALILAAVALLPYALELFDFYFVQQRTASYEERFQVYSQSWQWIKESPILGYGTQVTVPNLLVPLGSHNWYLGVLFKHGVLGLIPLLFFLLIVVAAATRNVLLAQRSRKKLLAVALFLAISGHLILCLTAEPIVDAVHAFFVAVIYGAALTFRSAAVRSKGIGVAASYGT